MKKTLYEQVPVTEGLPEEGQNATWIMPGGHTVYAHLDTREGRTWVYEEDEPYGSWAISDFSWWLRPVTVTLPQEVSDEAIGKYAVLLTQYVEGQPDFMDVKNNCTNAMTHMRDLLLPYLATLQGEVKEYRDKEDHRKSLDHPFHCPWCKEVMPYGGDHERYVCVNEECDHKGAAFVRTTLEDMSAQLPVIKTLQGRIEELENALKKIASWELPETGKFWDKEETRPLSYEAEYGSNGVRDYIKKIAQDSLTSKPKP